MYLLIFIFDFSKVVILLLFSLKILLWVSFPSVGDSIHLSDRIRHFLTPSGKRNRGCYYYYCPPTYTGRPKYIKHSGNTHKTKNLHLNRLLGVAKH